MSRFVRDLVGLGVLALMAVGAAPQQARADALHVFCVSPTPTCTDNGTITPTTSTSPHFGFIKSPNSGTDTFFLEVLIPDNVLGANAESFSITGTNTGNASVSSSLFSSTAWTSGFLDAYLGVNATPNNPIGAFLPSTQTLGADPLATGYYDYQFDFGAVTFGSTTDPIFFAPSFLFPEGTVIVGLADHVTVTCKKIDGIKTCTPNDDWIATASSSALIDSPPGSVPEPTSAALMIAGLLGLGAVYRRKHAA
jgi:hypothetical protein